MAFSTQSVGAGFNLGEFLRASMVIILLFFGYEVVRRGCISFITMVTTIPFLPDGLHPQGAFLR